MRTEVGPQGKVGLPGQCDRQARGLLVGDVRRHISIYPSINIAIDEAPVGTDTTRLPNVGDSSRVVAITAGTWTIDAAGANGPRTSQMCAATPFLVVYGEKALGDSAVDTPCGEPYHSAMSSVFGT